jgi:hypothetical protein
VFGSALLASPVVCNAGHRPAFDVGAIEVPVVADPFEVAEATRLEDFVLFTGLAAFTFVCRIFRV